MKEVLHPQLAAVAIAVAIAEAELQREAALEGVARSQVELLALAAGPVVVALQELYPAPAEVVHSLAVEAHMDRAAAASRMDLARLVAVLACLLVQAKSHYQEQARIDWKALRWILMAVAGMVMHHERVAEELQG